MKSLVFSFIQPVVNWRRQTVGAEARSETAHSRSANPQQLEFQIFSVRLGDRVAKRHGLPLQSRAVGGLERCKMMNQTNLAATEQVGVITKDDCPPARNGHTMATNAVKMAKW